MDFKEASEMRYKDYPLHPGQTHVEPMYATVPLEHYEQLKEESRNVAAIKASIEAILRELMDKGLLEYWYFNGTYHATIRTEEIKKLEKEFQEKGQNRGVLK